MATKGFFRFASVRTFFLLVLLAACGSQGGGAGGEATATPTPTPTPELASSSGGGGEEEQGGQDDAAEADDAEDSEQDAAGLACFPGTWQINNSSYSSFLNAAGGDPGGSTINLQGDLVFDFKADGTFTTQSSNYAMVLCSDDGCITAGLQYSGAGTWSADGGVLTTSGGSIVSVDFQGGEGEAVGGPGMAEYSCTPTTLTLTLLGGEYAGLPSLQYDRVE